MWKQQKTTNVLSKKQEEEGEGEEKKKHVSPARFLFVRQLYMPTSNI